ncbi:MAG: type II toxin-antitoxin system RelE/ParE family toxin [Streptosporangiales bacterium]
MADEQWRVSLSSDVEKWYDRLGARDKTLAERAIARLQEKGPNLREPHSKPLGDGVHELRFKAENVNRRVTYYQNGNEFRTLTTFRKQRQNERHEVEKAKLRMKQDRTRLAERGRDERSSAGRGSEATRNTGTTRARGETGRSGQRERGKRERSGGKKRQGRQR